MSRGVPPGKFHFWRASGLICEACEGLQVSLLKCGRDGGAMRLAICFKDSKLGIVRPPTFFENYLVCLQGDAWIQRRQEA